MTAVSILALIFTFIIIVSTIEEKEKTKRQKMKIEATLRSEEMARGYAPGTYSDLESIAEEDGEGKPRVMTRADLEKGISDLEERIRNLDSIIREKK